MSAHGVRLSSRRLLLAGLVAVCTCAKPPPDTDATPAGANALALDTPRREVLDCGSDDCADWFRVEVPGKGKLAVDLAAEPEPGADVRISISLADGQGATLARDQTNGRVAISVSAEVEPATYLIAVASNHPTAQFAYTVTARLALPPPPPAPPVAKPKPRPKPVVKAPPPPRFETRRAEVLESDQDGPHGRAVLLDAGAAQGLRVGLRGRLLDGGRTIAALEIVEVYPEGCLARVEGAGSAAIGATNTAEIDIPLPAEPAKK